jgi:hypothetical protein
MELHHEKLGKLYVEALVVPNRENILLGRNILSGLAPSTTASVKFCRPTLIVIDWRSGEWNFGHSSFFLSIAAWIFCKFIGPCKNKEGEEA